MTAGPYRRKRRPSDNAFLTEDERAWRRLVKAATAQARAPLASSEALGKAGVAAGRAVIPPGHRERGSCFLALAGLARTWWRLTPAEREARATDLAQGAEACAAALDRLGESGAPPPRADIYG